MGQFQLRIHDTRKVVLLILVNFHNHYVYQY